LSEFGRNSANKFHKILFLALEIVLLARPAPESERNLAVRTRSRRWKGGWKMNRLTNGNWNRCQVQGEVEPTPKKPHPGMLITGGRGCMGAGAGVAVSGELLGNSHPRAFTRISGHGADAAKK
jgi:hypothetical protein